MNIVKLNIWLSLLAANVGLIAVSICPASASALDSDKAAQAKDDYTLLLTSNTISTSATDLVNSQSKTVTDKPIDMKQVEQIKAKQVAQRDLEKFCQDFPYNSRCRGITPSDEPSESESIPVPPPQNQKSGWAIAPEISTQGIGGQIVRRVSPQLNARVGINGFGRELDIEDTEATYEGDLNLFNVSTLLDYHPTQKSGFKLSGGIVFANNNIEGTAETEESINLGNGDFSQNQVGSTDVNIDITRDVAPYVGLGWGNAVANNKGFGFLFNAGVMFGGSLAVEITPNINEGVSPEDEARIREEAAQEESDLEDELDFISVYPVISLGISYQF